MRFVLITGLLGFIVALAGPAFFDMSWTTAVAIWMLSGPAGAIVALLSALTPVSDRAKAPVAAPAQRQAA
jgi:hypothetical protein